MVKPHHPTLHRIRVARLLLELHQPREVHAIVTFEPREVNTPQRATPLVPRGYEKKTRPWKKMALFGLIHCDAIMIFCEDPSEIT